MANGTVGAENTSGASEPRWLSRRDLLMRGLAGSAALGLTNTSRARARLLPAGLLSAPSSLGGGLPTPADMYRDVKQMVDFGVRFTGTDAHNAFIDWLDDGFRSAGCAMLPRDEFPFTRWLVDDWSLELLEGPGKGVIPLAAYQPYSGNTPAEGIVAPLAYLGAVPPLGLPGNPQDTASLQAAIQRLRGELDDWARAAIAGIPGGVKGRIVMVDTQTLPLTERDFAPLTTYNYDPGTSPLATPDFKRMVFSEVPSASVFIDAGAAGYICTLDASPACAAGIYGPYGNPITGLPSLFIDRDTGAKLRQYAEGRPNARLTQTASIQRTSTPQLVGILPGDGSTDELIILNTHTDGMNAFEENGGVGLVWLARYFASLTKSRRLKRSLVFSAVSGHFAGPDTGGDGLPQTEGFIARHPDLVKRAAASLTIEHLGASEWLDTAAGYVPTGGPDMFVIWHSQTPIAAPVVESMVGNDLRHSRALRPAGDYMIAVGTAFNERGVPTVSSIVAPNYLVSWADGGHFDKFMPARAAQEVRWAADLVTRLDAMPAAELAAGDSTVLRTGLACQDPAGEDTCIR
jgi:hypothetical protein